MMTVRASAGLGVAAVLLAGGWLAAGRADPPAEPGDAAAPAGRPGPPARAGGRPAAAGSAGCSGIACHGGPLTNPFPPPRPGAVESLPQSGWVAPPDSPELARERWRSSETVFRCYDPHTRAFAVLGNDLSGQIEARLARDPAHRTDARADVRCLACHANPGAVPETQPGKGLDERTAELVAAGVSCEACHGNADPWIAQHAGWPHGAGHAARLTGAGMTHLSDPLVRATTCAGCHIGAPGGDGTPVRDMNHDLIAAGHPRLNFDYGTYLRALPPHWAEKDRDVSPVALRPASDEFTHWLVGRAAMAAAADLLRADRTHRTWPELAEFDCYACHHGLTGRPRDPLGDRPGALLRNEVPFGAQITALKPGDPDAPRALARELAKVTPRRWDEACHLYYALVAIDRAAGPGKAPPADPKLAKVRDALRLPQEAGQVKYNSPLNFDPAGLGFANLFAARGR